jgi:hypothetical protein
MFLGRKQMKKLAVLIIALMVVSVGFLCGCTETKEKLKIIVMNDYVERVYVRFGIYYDTDIPVDYYFSGALEPNATYNFTSEYERSEKIIKIGIAAYNSSEYEMYQALAYDYYEFPDNECYNLLGIISESGNTITIVKL